MLLVTALLPVGVAREAPSQDAEIVARGFKQPFAVAVSAAGQIVVSDLTAGTVTEIAPDGRHLVVLHNLEGPAGLAFDEHDGLLIAEERGGRVLRRDRSGIVAVLASGIARPRWIAAGAAGAIYVSARHDRSDARRDDDDDDDDGEGGERILRLMPTGAWRTFADGLQGLEGIAYSDGVLYAAARRAVTDRARDATRVVRFAIQADGSAGPRETVLRGDSRAPVGLALDRLGAVVATTKLDGDDDDRERGGAVIKRLPNGQVATLVTGLRNPRGLAFETAGHLLVVEGAAARRLRRLRAPPAPSVTAPAFTNQSPVVVAGRAGAGDLGHVFPEGTFEGPLATAVADRDGAFGMSIPIQPNVETRLSFTATAAGGSGLTSAPASYAIAHDDGQPAVTILEPPPVSYTRDPVPLRARGEDDGSGVASMAAMWDDALAGVVDNPAPLQPLVMTALLTTAALAEGPRTLTVTASDRAGNTASAASLVVIDRTPPDTRIASGPDGKIAETSATFAVEGTDLLSPGFEFAWRLDEGSWSPFSALTSVSLNSLTPGAHRFEVKARDLAGNEDPTPAVQTFSVRSLRIRITDPANGATITTRSVWLRGTVEGGDDVAVTVPLPPGMRFPSLPASVEGGMFAVEVPVDATTIAITAIATDAATGATVAHSISIVVQPDAAPLASDFSALSAGGLAPHVVTFSVNLSEGTRIELDLDGDGTVDFDGTVIEGLPFVYERAGIYVPALRATSPDGDVVTYRTVVEVYDRAALNARVQAVWSGFMRALQGGDVTRAAGFIHGNRRATWLDYFGQRLPAELAAEAGAFTSIELVQAGRGGAEYEMFREENGRVFSYPVVFVADADGRWRLWQF